MKKVVQKPWPGAFALKRLKVGGGKAAVPFPVSGEFTRQFESLWEFRRDNLFTTPRGDMYLLHYLSGGKGAGRGGGDAEVIHIRPDGTIAAKPLITKLLAPASVKVDSRGHIYVAENLKPPGHYWPKGMDKFISSLPKKVQTEYGELYGSVLKFKPEGGTVIPAGKAGAGPKGARELHLCVGEKKYYVTGLADVYVGTAPRPPVRTGFRSKCWCLSGSMDLDLHDRLYVPDSGRFTVRVLDSNFNEITSIGSYGSVDDPVGPSRTGGDIPLECPTEVFVSDKAVYITDQAPAAGRSMRVKLGYALEKSCPIPGFE
jgi:hypothetical protein